MASTIFVVDFALHDVKPGSGPDRALGINHALVMHG